MYVDQRPETRVPIRKCPRVRGWRSFGSDDIGDRGREFITASISQRSVAISWNVKDALASIRTRWCFAILTAASKSPPKWGERGGENIHWMPSWVHASLTCLLCSSDMKSWGSIPDLWNCEMIKIISFQFSQRFFIISLHRHPLSDSQTQCDKCVLKSTKWEKYTLAAYINKSFPNK